MNSEQYSTDAGAGLLVSEILTQFQTGGPYPRTYIERLTKLAISEDTQVRQQASKSFIGSLVETLADSFEPAAVSFYNRAFAQLIQACRNTERGRPVDERLKEFGLRTEADVLARAEHLRTSWESCHLSAVDRTQRVGNGGSQPGRVIVLSRVTLGADVAITSVMIERFKIALPQTEIVVLGGRKASELFGGDRRLAFKEINYPRGATATERLLAWLPLVDCVRELTEGVEQSLIVDPDSRLTQLGLLPLTSHARAGADRSDYLFFPSREYDHDSTASLAELTSAWLDETLGPAQPAYPSVSLRPADVEAARSFIRRIKRERRPVITINFGVGGNQSKRVGVDFEKELVNTLLQEGALVVLDKGAGAGEARSAEAVIEFARRASNDRLRLIGLDEQSLARPGEGRIEAQLVAWSGRIGLLAALIGESALYIGYDSAGQHIASALGVPCIDVFAGFSSRRMLDRWLPRGKAETRVVVVEHSTIEDEVLAETLRHARQLLNRRTG